MAGLNFSVHLHGMDDIVSALANASTKAEHVVAVQIQKDTEPFVPALTKTLANDTKVINNTVVYPGPYARYLYFGKLMVDPVTGSSYARKGATKVLTDKNLVIKQTVNPQAQSFWFEASKAQNLDKWVRVADKAVKSKLGK